MCQYGDRVTFSHKRTFLGMAIGQLSASKLASRSVTEVGRALPLCPSAQTSICSAIASASSTSIPRYLTVLSTLVWPSSN